MKSFKITLLTIAAALLAWPAAASHNRETLLDYGVDLTPSPPALNELRTISRWKSGSRVELDLYEAADQRWVYDFDNIDPVAVEIACLISTPCMVTLVGRDSGGSSLASMTFDADVSESMGQLKVKIDSDDHTNANDFVTNLSSLARILDQVVVLEVEKDVPGTFARAKVEYQLRADGTTPEQFETVSEDQVFVLRQLD